MMSVGERKTMRQGGDLGEMVGAMRWEVVPPLYTMGRFGHVPSTAPIDTCYPTTAVSCMRPTRPHSLELKVKALTRRQRLL